MTEAISRDRAVIDAAIAGDEEAFRGLVEPLYRELHLHCYRMLGSFHDAEDVVQEALLRAWKGLSSYDGRAGFRTWLYRVTTNTCLDALRRRRRRVLPQDLTAAADPTAVVGDPSVDLPWLEPYPDALLHAAAPEARAELREGVSLAFLRAVQLLTPRQRAALILFDVLDWSAADVAGLLGSSVAAANSAVQRARATLRKAGPETAALAQPANERDIEVARRYAKAFEAGDVKGIARLLRDDVVASMPPLVEWYDGRLAFEAFLRHSVFAGEPPPAYRLFPTSANGALALAVYRRLLPGQAFEALAIKVLTLRGGRVAEVTAFADPRLFPLFGFAVILED